MPRPHPGCKSTEQPQCHAMPISKGPYAREFTILAHDICYVTSQPAYAWPVALWPRGHWLNYRWIHDAVGPRYSSVMLWLPIAYVVDGSAMIGPIPWGHSGPLCHALSLLSLSLSSMLLWTSTRRRRATVATPGAWQCKTGGVRRLAVANGPNIFKMLLVSDNHPQTCMSSNLFRTGGLSTISTRDVIWLIRDIRSVCIFSYLAVSSIALITEM